ncbi:DUF1385 domain-containing protein [Candidatus Woesearchaeota archaeon]|nr:DUF1385 domain-containing protein [Candidatus Woesearchaeota archaeon]MCF7901724.1 DUF1385 domain-containing protein [Candidatus Woesearchaeota archaeon]MCF8014080.1 DUF1385 domain-containing protein [Candidatus Woesearchaeota archaeon]
MPDIKIGGQAVIDGVTMRSENYVCTSVRDEKGKIRSRLRKFKSVTQKNKILKLPILRGVVSLVEMVSIGFSELQWSAQQASEEEELSSKEIFFTMLFSIIVAIVVFKYLPWLSANALSSYFNTSYVVLNIIDGVLKIGIIALYMFLIGKLKDVYTLFQYHGAEHKAVSCYESKKKLTPDNAHKFSTIHPRCGTTFVILVFVVSVFVYVLLPEGFSFWQNLGLRILLLPVIAGIAFELIRLSGKYYDKSSFVRAIMWPGLQFQRLTTNKPNKKQIEVAIMSLNKCMLAEKKH